MALTEFSDKVGSMGLRVLKTVCLCMVWGVSVWATTPSKQTIVFEEQRIEGKIRRPQLVLITADQRPEFKPMVIQDMGAGGSIVEYVNERVFEADPHADPFRFSGPRITGYVP